jgi:hypothetical protein
MTGPDLDRPHLRRALAFAMVEGLCYAVMVGLGETWFVPYAVRLGAGVGTAGLLLGCALGCGGVGALLAVLLMRRVRTRKPLVLAGIGAQVVALVSLPWVPAREGVPLLFALVGTYHVGAQLAGTAWASWFGDAVPARYRGRYFGRRTRWIHALTFTSVLVAGSVIQTLDGPEGTASDVFSLGFAIMFSVAAAARLLSFGLISFTPEPTFGGLVWPTESWRIFREEGRDGGRLLVLAAALNVAVYVASPYFGPFMLTELRFDYWQFTLAQSCVILLKVVMMPRWGRAVDQYGSRAVFLLAIALVSCTPIPWLWAEGIAWVLAAQLFSGFAWGAYEISNFTQLLQSSSARVRPILLAANNLVVGLSQLAGTLIGESLATEGPGSLRRVFAISTGLRILVAVCALRVVRRLSRDTHVRAGQLLLRVIGFRPQGGLAHRPVVPNDPPPRRRRVRRGP